MSQGVGPPSPPDAAAALQPGTMLRAEREGAAGTAPSPVAPAGRLWCRAFLLLAVCVCTTAVPYGLGVLAAVTWDPPGSSASQQRVGASLVTACGDLLTSGCFPEDQGVVTLGPGAGGRYLGTRTAATWTSQTSREWQPGSGDREGLRLSPAMAVTLSPARWPGKRMPATSSRLFQTEGVPSPGSWHHLTERGLHRAGPGSHGATWMPAVTSAGTAEPQSPQRGSEATSRAWSEPAAGLPATSQVWLHPSLPTAAVMQVSPNQLVPLQGAAAGSQIPPDVPTWTLMDAGSWSPTTAEQLVTSALPTPGTPSSAQLHPGTMGVPPALAAEGLWDTALPGKAVPVLAQVPGNGSGLLDAVLASLPTTVTAPGAHSQRVPTSSLPTAESGAPAVTSGTQRVTLDTRIMSSGSGTSQNSSTAMEHLPAATREAFSPAELMTEGKPGSTGMKPPASHPSSLPFPTQPVHVLPLQFRLLGIAYTPALGSRNSESYQQLEGDVRLMLNQMLSSYENFLQANVLEFMNGSVVVRGEVLFRGDAPAPTNSHLIRTVLTEASKGRSIFSWQLDPQSVQSGGFSLENLDPEKLSVSLTGFQLGTNRMDPLERLVREVMSSVSAFYHVRNFTISQLRTLGGGTEVTGDLYLDTVVHADVTEVLEALTTLSDLSIDLTSLSVEGSKLGLYVYPLSLVVTNRHFSQKLQDPLSEEHHNLSMDLGDAVVRVLSDYPTLLKVIIKEFLPGSVTCHGNMIFRHPAPTSMEVLRKLVLSVGPDHALGDSDIHVDPYSLAVGEDTLDPPLHRPSFPAYGVAIMVIGGLCIITAPIVLVCLGTKKLGWRGGRALWNRRDPEVGIQTLEMDNQGVWTEDSDDGHFEWQSTST
ncbi:uncharacterized protein M8220_009191 isoform 2-T4 [Acridotheres tristis]